jgi:hypothetical protein
LDNSAKSDHDTEIYDELDELGYSTNDADAHLIVDPRSRTLSMPKYGRTDFISKWMDQRYVMQVSNSQSKQAVDKLVRELNRLGLINDKYKFISENAEDELPRKDGVLYMYHGTTESAASQIMKKGLRPMDTVELGRKSKFRGNSSTIAEYTDKNVYLTPSIDIAKTYAWRQAEHNDDNWAVLRVEIPDPARLYIDDDRVLKRLLALISQDRTKLQKQLTKDSEEYEEVVKRMKSGDKLTRSMISDFALEHYPGTLVKTPWSEDYVYTFGDYEKGLVQANLMSVINGDGIKQMTVRMSYADPVSAAEYYQREIPGYYEWLEKKIIEHYPSVIKDGWWTSAYGDEQAVAYRGVIPPKFIEQVPVKYKMKKY